MVQTRFWPGDCHDCSDAQWPASVRQRPHFRCARARLLRDAAMAQVRTTPGWYCVADRDRLVRWAESFTRPDGSRAAVLPEPVAAASLGGRGGVPEVRPEVDRGGPESPCPRCRPPGPGDRPVASGP